MTTTTTSSNGTAPTSTWVAGRAIETAKTMGELISATDKARAHEQGSSDEYYSAGDAVYVKIKNTGRWPGKIDKILKARRLRKLYYETAAHEERAAQCLSAAIFEAQTILAEAKAQGRGFDATK